MPLPMKVKGQLEEPLFSLYHVGFGIKLKLIASIFTGSQNHLLRPLPMNIWPVIKIISLICIFHWIIRTFLG